MSTQCPGRSPRDKASSATTRASVGATVPPASHQATKRRTRRGTTSAVPAAMNGMRDCPVVASCCATTSTVSNWSASAVFVASPSVAQYAGSADTQQVDIREKTFADEAIEQLDFLRSQYDFAGPDVSRGPSPGTTVRVKYHRDGTTIEACLVLWYMGEEYVATTQIAAAPHRAEQRAEIAHNTAHTGYQMRRALKLHGDAVRATMHQP
jgi:hypothetical protein